MSPQLTCWSSYAQAVFLTSSFNVPWFDLGASSGRDLGVLHDDLADLTRPPLVSTGGLDHFMRLSSHKQSKRVVSRPKGAIPHVI